MLIPKNQQSPCPELAEWIRRNGRRNHPDGRSHDFLSAHPAPPLRGSLQSRSISKSNLVHLFPSAVGAAFFFTSSLRILFFSVSLAPANAFLASSLADSRYFFSTISHTAGPQADIVFLRVEAVESPTESQAE